MHIPKGVTNWIWFPILIAVLALLAIGFKWPFWATAPVLIAILVIGLTLSISGARKKELETSLLKLRQSVGYFNRRFMGDSSLSIFAIIDSLFRVDEPKLWDWARACDMSRRVFNTWCTSFLERLESDVLSGRLETYIHTYINEMWLLNNHYYEFIEQFYEIAETIEMPKETIDQYNRFVMEYNAFAQEFRNNISNFKKTLKTEIEPPSIRFAKELAFTVE
jgi:hypothetical protein